MAQYIPEKWSCLTLEATLNIAFGRSGRGSESGRRILSGGRQHLRAMAKPDYIAVHVCDWFGGTASRAEEWYLNYGKGRLLKTDDTLRGNIHLRPVFLREVSPWSASA